MHVRRVMLGRPNPLKNRSARCRNLRKVTQSRYIPELHQKYSDRDTICHYHLNPPSFSLKHAPLLNKLKDKAPASESMIFLLYIPSNTWSTHIYRWEI